MPKLSITKFLIICSLTLGGLTAPLIAAEDQLVTNRGFETVGYGGPVQCI